MADLASPVQCVGTAAPKITRKYPKPSPIATYAIYYSKLLEFPPTHQGDPGDFYISKDCVYYKTQRNRWIKAHFNKTVTHPSMNDIHLCYGESGPCWVRGAWSDGPGWRAEQVAFHFHEAKMYYQPLRQGPGNDPNSPIEIDAD